MKSKGKTERKPAENQIDTEETLQKMGKRIRALRIKAGYSNYEFFAYEHELPRAQYGRYEQGKDLRFSSLITVINALGVTIPEFFSEGFE